MMTRLIVGCLAWLVIATTANAQFPDKVGFPPQGGLAVPSLPTFATLPSTAGQVSATAHEAPAPTGGEQAGGEGGQQDNGTNPAQNPTTFIFDNEYYTLDGNNRINTTYARFKFPLYDKRGSFLVEVPYIYYNFKASDPRLPQVGGLGDVRFQGSFNTWSSEDKKLTVINLLELYVPSADNTLVSRLPNSNDLTAFNLGTGKFVIGPGLGAVYAFAPNFFVAPLYFYEASIFGNSDRQNIRRGKWRIFAMYALGNGLYMLPELQIVTNYLNGNNDIYFAPELGYGHKKTTLFVKPGIGIDPDTNDRQWGIEFGARIQF